jgi:hypothetical protein
MPMTSRSHQRECFMDNSPGGGTTNDVDINPRVLLDPLVYVKIVEKLAEVHI